MRTLLRSGCDDFIHKPFREATVFEVLARHLDVRFIDAEVHKDRFRRTVHHVGR